MAEYKLNPRTVLVKPGPDTPVWAKWPYHKIDGEWWQQYRGEEKGFHVRESDVIHMIKQEGFKEVLPMAAPIRPVTGKTYRASVKGAPDAQFEIHMRFVGSRNSADVTINPRGEAKQLGGVPLDHYELLEEIKPPVELPTGNYAVIGRADGNTNFGHFTLHNKQWWVVFDREAEKATEDRVRRSVEAGSFKVLFEGLKKDPWEF